jgi:DNA-binding NtrC family response regulator
MMEKMDFCSEINLPRLPNSLLGINGYSLDKPVEINPAHERKLLMVSPLDEFQDIVQLLRAEGWEVIQVSSIAALDSSRAAKECYVGLVGLDKLVDSELAEIEAYMQANRQIEWISLLSHDGLNLDTVCRFIRRYCFDYHLRPVDRNRLLMAAGHAYGKSMLCRSVPGEPASVGRFGMIGKSQEMEEIYRGIEKIHSIAEPVLISGESGTGKELVARAIHQLSSRRDKPFIAVNCGALPHNLIQSELFGHEKGSFTGAHQRKIGRIEAASNGTIFLDEIGDLPMELQVNLLHFLQDKSIERVGSNLSIPVDARVIAATHVDLPKAIAQGKFREDLYYRINVLHLKMPPLRERGDDIPLLAQEFFKRFSCDREHSAQGFSQQALHAIRHHAWPGNVRELINRVRSAMVMSENRLLQPVDLGLNLQAGAKDDITLESSRNRIEQERLLHVLNRNRNNVTEAARELGVSRATMYRLIRKFKEGCFPDP